MAAQSNLTGSSYFSAGFAFFIYSIRHCFPSWSISVNTDEDNSSNSKHKSLKLHKEAKNKLPVSIMNNYFSIGADAKIALDFHAAREKNPAAFSSQAVNKIEYAKNYSKDLFKQSCKKLKDNISVFEVRKKTSSSRNKFFT
jgi:hypothetical protein